MQTLQKLEHLSGVVERITFHNQENGFCVLRAKVKGHRDLVTVIGNAASITAGENIECQGVWHNDKKHGLQFKAQHLKIIPPSTLEGMEKYLGSGMVKGIGPFFAKKLIRAFGTDVFDVIELQPERLTELEGIGEKRKQLVVSAWAEQKAIRDIMVFLQSHNIGPARAVRIFKTYGDQAMTVVSENPYRLALDIRGIGFKTADTIAKNLKIAPDSPLRAQAGVRHVLQELCERGHCAALTEQLIAASTALLEIPTPIISAAIEHEVKEKNLIEDRINDEACVFPVTLFLAEKMSAEHINRINKGEPPWGSIDCQKAIPWVEEKTGLQLSESQQQAIHQVLQNKVTIITGGPGVGKTTIVNSLLQIIRAKQLMVALCAPTGRAAKRMMETTGLAAKTVHRLLDYSPKTYSFKHNQENPLPIDVLIVDESSMLDILLFNSLLKAIPSHCAVIFVGDIDQLPSVGSGAVLSDLIKSGKIVTVRLTEIFRQAASSKIIANAHRINQGNMPLANEADNCDFYTLFEDSSESIRERLVELVCKRLPDFYQCNPILDIQVLTPMNRGGLGSHSLNIALQQSLNGHEQEKISRYGSTFARHDKVIQTINNYDKDIFNGDIGSISAIDFEENIIKINFDNRLVDYDISEIDEISLAYAISIHKSQGSEFPIVVIPIATEHYTLLARNLLYTGVTRGKKLVVLLGQKKAIGMAIKNNKEARRLTKLADRLCQ